VIIMGKEIIQEIYGEDSGIRFDDEISDAIKKLKEKYGDDWVDHVNELED